MTNLNCNNIGEYKKYIMLKEFVYKLYKYIKNVDKIPNVKILSYKNDFKNVIKYYDENEYEFIFDYNTKDKNNFRTQIVQNSDSQVQKSDVLFKLTYIENGIIDNYIEPISVDKLAKSDKITIKEFLKEKFPKFIIF